MTYKIQYELWDGMSPLRERTELPLPEIIRNSSAAMSTGKYRSVKVLDCDGVVIYRAMLSHQDPFQEVRSA